MKVNKGFVALFLSLFFFVNTVFAEEFIERSMTLDSVDATNGVEARKEITDKIIKSVSESVITDLIGNDKWSQSQNLIHSKIISQAPRYIAYQKNSEVAPVSEKVFRMSLSLKISLDTLKSLLNSNGLLGQTGGNPLVMPFISLVNEDEGSEYIWWEVGNEKALQHVLAGAASRLETSLSNSFLKDGLYLIRPMERKLYSLKHNISKSADFIEFAQKYEATLYLTGKVRLSKENVSKNRQRVDVKIQAYHVKNTKLITEVVRSFEVESGKFDQVFGVMTTELASQVSESWQKGSAGANVIRLVFKSHLNPKLQELVKEKIKSQVVQVGLIRERLVEGDSVTFEMGSQQTAEFLLSKLNGLEIDGKVLAVKLNSAEEILAELALKKEGI